MGWFRKKEKASSGSAVQDAQRSEKAQKIADGIIAVQARWAAKLNAQAQKLGPVRTKLLLCGLGIGFGFYCIWLVLSAFM